MFHVVPRYLGILFIENLSGENYAVTPDFLYARIPSLHTPMWRILCEGLHPPGKYISFLLGTYSLSLHYPVKSKCPTYAHKLVKAKLVKH